MINNNIYFRIRIIILIFSLSFPLSGKERKSGGLFLPYDLKCEYLTRPAGLECVNPRLSWKLKQISSTDQRGLKQTACQILVAGSEGLLKQNKGDVWDSGKIKTDHSVNVSYNGKPLSPGKTYYWKVRVTGKDGKWSAWSEPSCWSMGLFPDNWRAKWIGSEEAAGKKLNDPLTYNEMPDPWFRKTFTLQESPKRAFIYVASIGYHELYVNGVKAGTEVLVPSVTNHRKRARYVTYDVTDLLTTGHNVFAIWAGVSWSIFPAYQTPDKPAAPIILAQAEIELPNKEIRQIITDESWKVHNSPNTLIGYWEAHHFGGEKYDATLEIENWCDHTLDDTSWKQAVEFHPDLILSPDIAQPNRMVTEIEPVTIEEVTSGTYRVDMGLNFAGWFEMEVKGETGDEITFRFSERIEHECSYGIHSKYIIGPKKEGKFRNRFNYMTGRWVTISGLRQKPEPEQIKAWMIRPDYERAGAFECNIPLFNEIYNTACRTFENLTLGNYVVDCPHRERSGYGGDALATTRPGMGNYGLGAFYTKWMEDWRDVQHEDGFVPHTAPTYIGGGGPSWSGYCISLPWEMYCWYGDKRILQESFPTIERWLAYLETHAQDDMLVRWGGKWSFLGDWLWPKAWDERSRMEKQGKALGDTEETLFFNNCHWIYSLETAAKIADLTGNTQQASGYRKRASVIRKTVHDHFYNPEKKSYVNGLQAYLAMALLVELPPEELREAVWKTLEEEILIGKNGHFWGGITAGSYLFYTLMDQNRNDLLYTMISKEEFPGWGKMIHTGLGTFFEDWECRGSGLHSSYLYVGSWFIENLGGIKRPQQGYSHFIIEPWIDPNKGPEWVRSSHESLYGTIITNWKKENSLLQIEIHIPVNTQAILRLQNIDPKTLKENGKTLKEQKIPVRNTENKITEIELPSGVYYITTF